MKRYISVLLFVFISLFMWIIWSSNNDMNSRLLINEKKILSMNSNLLRPSTALCKNNPFLTIIVTSYVGHVELRSAHRRAMPKSYLKSMNVTRVFLLARIPKDEKFLTQKALENENSIYEDILQGSFIDSYRNLTLKHLMGLQWASKVCRPTYILKVDDDIVFNLESTFKLLLKLGVEQNLMMGYILNNTTPKRNKENKWFVSYEEYIERQYPTYLSGWYYITTKKIASMLIEEALYYPHFWIDDIYITGILPQGIGIKLQHVPNDYWLEYYELLECCISDMINKFIRCDYVVGPNGGRNNLIVEFNEALSHCDKWKNCTKRSLDTPLKKVCVMKRDRDIFSSGHGEVKIIQ